MTTEKIYKTRTQNGIFSCGDIGVSKEEWYRILLDEDALKYIDVLLLFLREPNNESSCTFISKKYGGSRNYYNSKIYNFGRLVRNKLKRFRILDSSNEKESYWPVVMSLGRYVDNVFVYKLRDELVDSLRLYLKVKLINDFFEHNPFESKDEILKEKILAKASEYDRELDRLVCRYFGYESSDYETEKSLYEIEKSFAEECGERILQELGEGTREKVKSPQHAVRVVLECTKDIMSKELDGGSKQEERDTANKTTWHDDVVKILCKRKNIVLSGAPGTGKTYEIPELAVRLCEPLFDVDNAGRKKLIECYEKLKKEKRVVFTTFHQSMDYEDWVEGLKPVVNKGQVTYKVESGIFKRICKEAERHSEESVPQPYIIVIDEMNRGNVSKIFGELITLIESDKRKGCNGAESVVLSYSKELFSVPDNLYIVATMNTADRSLGFLDYAIRRRFAFIPMKPQKLEADGFDAELFEKVSKLFVSNFDEYKKCDKIYDLPLKPAETLSEEYRPEDVWIGHSYFLMKDEAGENLKKERLLYEIIPLLEEYVRDGVLTKDSTSTINELRKEAME